MTPDRASSLLIAGLLVVGAALFVSARIVDRGIKRAWPAR